MAALLFPVGDYNNSKGTLQSILKGGGKSSHEDPAVPLLSFAVREGKCHACSNMVSCTNIQGLIQIMQVKLIDMIRS